MNRHRTGKLLLILMVTVCTLVVSISATLLPHDHGAGPNTCNLCAIFHLAWQQPANFASLFPPSMREWRDATEFRFRLLEPGETETPSRAPPPGR
jgi:hypothetical protein